MQDWHLSHGVLLMGLNAMMWGEWLAQCLAYRNYSVSVIIIIVIIIYMNLS